MYPASLFEKVIHQLLPLKMFTNFGATENTEASVLEELTLNLGEPSPDKWGNSPDRWEKFGGLVAY